MEQKLRYLCTQCLLISSDQTSILQSKLQQNTQLSMKTENELQQQMDKQRQFFEKRLADLTEKEEKVSMKMLGKVTEKFVAFVREFSQYKEEQERLTSVYEQMLARLKERMKEVHNNQHLMKI